MAGSRGGATRLFFAADIHGSQVTFRKFLAAADFYGVDALVFGGDLMGKALVPIVRTQRRVPRLLPGTRRGVRAGRTRAVHARRRAAGLLLEGLRAATSTRPSKPIPLAKHGLFHELASARLAEWIELAEDRLRGTGVRLYMTGGNDDEPAVLETLDRHEGDHVVASEGRLVDLDGEHTMITVGLSTFTPWDTPREASEEEIARTIEAAAASCPTSAAACSTCTAPRRTRRSTRA